MSPRNRALEAIAAESEQSPSTRNGSDRAPQFVAGQPIPLVLTIAQLAALLQVSARTVHQWRTERSHPGIKQLDMPGDPRFCGRTLKAWLDGGVQVQPVARRFFGSARKRTA